jgi:signal transduction histidine kinase/CheY-like chemotaxis protein
MLVLLVLSGVVALAVLITMQNRAADARDEAMRRQSHSYEVMIRAQAVSGAVATAEATLGRYVISLEKPLGRRYVEQWRQAGVQLDTLDRVIDSGRAEDADMARLRQAYATRGNELAQIARYSNSKRGSMAALSLYYQGRDTPALRAVNATLNRIIDREHARLVERSDGARRADDQSNHAAWLLTLFGALLVTGMSLLGWLTAQSQAERAAADAEVVSERERAADLSAAVDAATAQLREEAQERAHAEAQLRQVQKMEAVGQLTGGIAHDFNNMLAVVLGGLDLAKRRLQAHDGDDAERHIDNAIEGANRAAALTRRLLAFARAEPLNPEAFDVDTLLLGMSDLLDRTLGDAIAVRVSTSNAGWKLWVDRHQLENAVLNLAVNARDAMDGRGTITIAAGTTTLAEGALGACAAGDHVTISVVDTGCGMTPEVIERVFEPFFTTKPVGKGTGLGLSQIFAFARQSEGEIEIESAPGKGTAVTLYLPRYLPAEAASPAPVSPASAPSAASQRGLTIVIVEDDPRVRALTVGAVEELGHCAVPCTDPRTIAATIDQVGTPDLILTDVLMPGMSGPEMIAGLGERIAGVAVLFATGFAGDAAAEMPAGYKVLRKPFTLAGLARAIDDAIADQRDTREAAE